MDKSHESLSDRLWGFVVSGPPRPRQHARWFDTIFPWPMPLAVVVVAWLLGHRWEQSILGEQLGSALQYGALIAVSIVVSCWIGIALANISLALTLFIPHIQDGEPRSWRYLFDAVQHGLAFANRQVGHVVALLTWSVLAVVWADSLQWELALVVAVWALGPLLVNQLASWLVLLSQLLFPKREREEVLDLNLRRRPLFFWATFVGFVLIALCAPAQWYKLVPGVLAFTLADILRHLGLWRFKRAILPGAPNQQQLLKQHKKQLRWAASWDVLAGPLVGLVILAGLLAANSLGYAAYDRSLSGKAIGVPVDYCTTIAPPAPAADLAMFLLADSHFHELAGRRFIGQMAFVEAIESVALRPVELDVLAPTSLWRFGSLYKDLAKQRNERLPWAHLGDLGDLACDHELASALDLLRDRFDATQFVGVTPGSHDKVFAGNFFWSPHWDSACKSKRMEKAPSNQRLFEDWSTYVSANKGRMIEVTPAWTQRLRGGALLTASPLGLVRDGQKPRGVLGVFLDTADGQAFDWGLSGAFGSFSGAQADAATQLAEEVKRQAGPAYGDPFYLVFLHNPLGDLRYPSGSRLLKWLSTLDKHGPRLVGLLSGHTHTSDARVHCIGKRRVPEIVLGSTLDPPQEAALLHLGPAPDGVLALRVQTIPAVARPGMTCSASPPSVSALECQTLMAKLRDEPSCRSLFQPAGAVRSSRECSDIEHPLDLQERMQQVIRWTGPGDEEEIRKDQRNRLKALWSCLCRAANRDNLGACASDVAAMDSSEGFFNDEVNLRLVRERLAADKYTEHELTCFAWAAAVMQKHKLAGMTFSDALRCSFDDETLPPAHDYIARMEETPCH
jgi:hypothetical protein